MSKSTKLLNCHIIFAANSIFIMDLQTGKVLGIGYQFQALYQLIMATRHWIVSSRVISFNFLDTHIYFKI